MTKPTDPELRKLAEECGIGWAAGLGGMDDFLRNFASAVLDRWGTSPATLSDNELVELGKSKSGLHPWGVGTTKADYLRAVRAVLDSVGQPPCPTTPPYTAPVEGSDTKRLDWMETMGDDRVLNLGTTWYARAGYRQPHRRHKDLRTAIDAAMAAQKEKK